MGVVRSHGFVLDDLLLLMLDEGRGTFRGGDRLAYGLAAALLSDLRQLRCIDIAAKAVTIVDTTRTGHALLDEHLARIAVGPQRPPDQWIGIFGRSELVERCADRLVTAGTLTSRIDRSLLSSVRRFAVVPPRLRITLRAYVRGVVLGDAQALPVEVTSLASILGALGERGILGIEPGQAIGPRAMAPSDVISSALDRVLGRGHGEAAAPYLTTAG